MERKTGNIFKMFFALMAAMAFCPFSVSAIESENYRINADTFGIGGGSSGSENYLLTDTVGEPVVGIGTSENYKEKVGFWYMVGTSLSISVDSSSVDLGEITPGTPVSGQSVISVTTDSWSGYDLLASENHQMTHTDTVSTIPDYACDIDSPCLWSGTGLGFTVSSGTQVESKWGSAPDYKYAYFPTSGTVFHSKTGFSSGSDDTTVGYKLDTLSSQKEGSYSNIITYTAMEKL